MRTWKLSVVACLAFAAGAAAQTNQPNVPVLKPQDNATMQAWTEANKVGDNQIKLALQFNGTWKTTSTVWMTPDAPAATSEGVATFTSTMGGRFVEGNSNTKLFGLPFMGKQIFGYNNATKQYESMWIDSETTGFQFTTGTRDGNNNIVWTGTTTDPVNGSKKTVKAKTSFPESGKMVFEMWDTTSDGKEFRALQIEYVKQPVANPGKGVIKTSAANTANTPKETAAEARKRKAAAMAEQHNTPEVAPNTTNH
ncbi:MAG: DUF1579 family protein [Phycisphaerales bacterium]|jgi:hypothetical protein